MFYFVFEGNFPSTSPLGAYILRGDLTEVFFALLDWGGGGVGLYLEGLIHGGAYLRNFTVCEQAMIITWLIRIWNCDSNNDSNPKIQHQEMDGTKSLNKGTRR